MSNLPETELFHKAIKHWWASKKGVAPKKAQGGTRDANLHGKTMDGFALAIRDFLMALTSSRITFSREAISPLHFIVTDETIATKKINHRIPLPEFGSANFLRSLKAQILTHYPGAKIKPGSLASKI